MKQLISIGLMMALLNLSGCRGQTKLGPCVGIDSEEDRNPALIYRPSLRNIVIGVFFFETIIVPAYVVFEEVSCPIKVK